MKLQLVIPMVLVLTGAGLSPQAQGATVNQNYAVSIDVMGGGGSCTFEQAGSLNSYYDPANPSQIDSSSFATVTCSSGTAWSLSYDQGLHAAAGSSCSSPMRRANSGASFVAYELYRDSGYSQMLGCDPGSVIQGSGTGSGQMELVYARIPLGQSPTATGAHTDTVVATLTF